MSNIKIINNASELAKTLKMSVWPIWTSPVCEFDWHYDDFETCFFLEGEVIVKTDCESIAISAGDIVIFPKDLDCRWEVKKAVKKHYNFGPVLEQLK